MTDTFLISVCISAFLTALCVVWTIRAANKITRDYSRLCKLEEDYKRYLDNYVNRYRAIVYHLEDYETFITVRKKESE